MAHCLLIWHIAYWYSTLQINWMMSCIIFHTNASKSIGNFTYRQFNIQQFYVLSTQVFMCFVWIWKQTAIISLYNINWQVFITETECVYCAVRTGSLYAASLTFSNSTFCPHSVFMCFVWIWEQTAIISLYSINWLVCITETECVYCAVRTGSLNIIQVTLKSVEVTSKQSWRCLRWAACHGLSRSKLHQTRRVFRDA